MRQTSHEGEEMKSFRILAGLLLMMGTGMAIGYVQSGSSQQPASGSSGKLSSASLRAYPKDVYPDPRNRLPLLKRENLSDDKKKMYDALVADPNVLAGLHGVAELRLNSSNPLGGHDYYRFHNPIGRRLSELCILVVAREVDGAFEWWAHVPEALRQGLEPDIIDVVRDRKALKGLGDKETVIIQIGREYFSTRRVSPATFARALRLFGPGDLFDLVALMGQVAGGIMQAAAFDAQVPADLPAADRARLPLR